MKKNALVVWSVPLRAIFSWKISSKSNGISLIASKCCPIKGRLQEQVNWAVLKFRSPLSLKKESGVSVSSNYNHVSHFLAMLGSSNFRMVVLIPLLYKGLLIYYDNIGRQRFKKSSKHVWRHLWILTKNELLDWTFNIYSSVVLLVILFNLLFQTQRISFSPFFAEAKTYQ